jgi:hypothetical protein
MITASAKPVNDRVILEAKCAKSSPVIIKFHQEINTLEKVGKNAWSTKPILGAISQIKNKATNTMDCLKIFPKLDNTKSFGLLD